jgi:hypothetical protein
MLGGFCFFLARGVSAQNIPNAGFEEDLTDWRARSGTDIAFASPEAAHSGSAGLKILDEDLQRSVWLESLPAEVLPGKKYEVSFWARQLSGEGAVRVTVRFLDEKEKPARKKDAFVRVDPSSEWKKSLLVAEAPENAVAAVVFIQSSQDKAIVADLDDFALRELPGE